MSVSIVSNPSAVVAAGNCVKYELENDDAGTPPESISAGYQLWVNGAAAMPVEQIPYSGQDEPIEFSDLIRSYLSTTFQVPGVTVEGLQDTAFTTSFYLKYGTITFDSSDCSVVQDVSTDHDTKLALNSAWQVWEAQTALTGSDAVILSNRPTSGIQRRGGNDWLWIYRESGEDVTVVFRFYRDNGTEILGGTQHTWTSAGVHIVSIGPGNHPSSTSAMAAAAYYKVEIRNGSLSSSPLEQTYTFRLMPNCNHVTTQANQLYWLEPKGGYAGIQFENVRIGGSVSSSRYDEGRPCGTSGSGRFRHGVEALKKITWNTVMPFKERLDEFLEGIFTTKYAFVRWNLANGTQSVVRVNILDGEYSLINNNEDISLTITGEFFVPMNTLD